MKPSIVCKVAFYKTDFQYAENQNKAYPWITSGSNNVEVYFDGLSNADLIKLGIEGLNPNKVIEHLSRDIEIISNTKADNVIDEVLRHCTFKNPSECLKK